MRTLIYIETKLESALKSKHIICRDKNGDKVATIFCDQDVKFASGVTITVSELEQIRTIANNFDLFYDNVQMAESR